MRFGAQVKLCDYDCLASYSKAGIFTVSTKKVDIKEVVWNFFS